jgi:methionine synthase I (cobalamin-dependent)
MLNTTDLARYRMADRMREAEAARLAREADGPRRAAARAQARHVAGAVAALMLWPVKH